MRRKWLIAAVFAAVFGLVCSYISIQRYIEINKNGAAEESFCAVNSYINCDIVEASTYSEIAGFPVAGFGIIFYAFVIMLSLYARFSKSTKKGSVAFAWWCSLASIAFSLYLAYISAFVLNVLCLTCAGMYLANLLIFISLTVALKMSAAEFRSFIAGYWGAIFSKKSEKVAFKPEFFSHLLFVIIVFGIGMIFVTSATSSIHKITAQDVDNYLVSFFKQSKYDLKFNKDGVPVWGKKGAPVEIVEFSDFMCPFCKVAAFGLKPFLAQYKNDIAFYFMNYPLDSDCNHYMEHQMHPGACMLAKAAICANAEGDFWAYHDKIFRMKEKPDREKAVKIAEGIGINREKFEGCIDSKETEAKLMNDIEAARRIYITGTPSVFVNDKSLRLWRSPEILRAVVEKEIENAKSPAR